MNEKVIPGSDIAPVSFPNVPPEKNVGKYFESKTQDGKIWKFPEWDVCRPEPAMDLILARRELLDADTKLTAKREEYKKDREILDAEWKELGENEEELRKSFIMFHKFVKENQEKKERARRRISEEESIHERRNEEIAAIEEKIEKMSNVRISLENSVKKLKIYEDYLSDVVAISPEYRSITSVLNRYDALSSARNDLVARQKLGLEELERERIAMMQEEVIVQELIKCIDDLLRKRMVSSNMNKRACMRRIMDGDEAKVVHQDKMELIEERVGVLMGLNNQMADLQSRYEKAKHQTRYWEKVVYKVKSKSASELLKIYLIQDSVWNLYQLMCMRKGMPIEIKKKDVEDQLTYIKGTISEYKRIVKIAAKKTAKDLSSVQTESGRSGASQ